jgi:hypothetical protein
MRRRSSALTDWSFARIRFLLVTRFSLKCPLLGLRTHVRKAEKVERFRLRETLSLTVLGGEPPELDQPCLVVVQPQVELRESFTQVSLEPFRVVTVLEAQHNVVSLCRVSSYAELGSGCL